MSLLSKTHQNLIYHFNLNFCQRNVNNFNFNEQNPKNIHCLELIKGNTTIETIYAIRKTEEFNISTDSQNENSKEKSKSIHNNQLENDNLNNRSIESSSDHSLDQFKLFCILNGAEKVAEKFQLTTQLVTWNIQDKMIKVLELKEYQKNLMLSILRRILQSEHTLVALFDSTELNSKSWNIIRYATPGNLNHFDELISESQNGVDKAHDSCTVMSIIVQEDERNLLKITFSTVNMLERLIIIGETNDDFRFNCLGSLFVSLNVKECIVYSNSITKKLFHSLEFQSSRCNIELSLSTKNQQFESDEGVRVIHSLIRSKYISDAIMLSQKITSSAKCISAASCLLNLVQNKDNHGYFMLKEYDTKLYLKLNSILMRELNVIPPVSNKKTVCLYTHLDRCKTRIGSRLLASWIRQPLIEVSEIERRQNFVEVFVDDPTLLENVISQISKFPDLDILLKKMHQQRLNLNHLYVLYLTANNIPALINYLESGLKCDYLEKLLSKLRNIELLLQNFLSLVQLTLDLSKAKNYEFIINPNLNSDLNELMQDWKYLEGCINSCHSKFCEEHLLEEEFVEVKKGKFSNVEQYYFKVPSKLVKEQGIILEQKKSYSLITTEGLQNISHSIFELKKEYEELQASIIKIVNSKVSTYLPVFSELRDCIAIIDVILSFASVATESNYTKPLILSSSKNEIQIKDGWHPLLEYSLDDQSKIIPNNVNLNKFRRFQIITGVNCGGKSTYLKMIGILIIMAQIGSFIPAKEGSLISIRDFILVRIGASDSLTSGVSTFLQEMNEAQSIISNATKNSIILIDELGRGTSTRDGFGLSWSISEYIIQSTNAMCLFATHFHELTALENIFQGVVNLKVSVHHDKEFLMEYKIYDGISGESLGIQVAKLAGFPFEVLNIANEKLNQLKSLKESRTEEYYSENDGKSNNNPIPKRRKLSQEFDTEVNDSNEVNNTIKLLKGNKNGSIFIKSFLKSISNINEESQNSTEEIIHNFQKIKIKTIQEARNDPNVGIALVQLKKHFEQKIKNI